MRDEQREINGADRSLAAETDDASMKMKINVGGEKGRGAKERGDHANAMLKDFLPTNEIVAAKQKNSAGGIESGVERGEGRKG